VIRTNEDLALLADYLADQRQRLEFIDLAIFGKYLSLKNAKSYTPRILSHPSIIKLRCQSQKWNFQSGVKYLLLKGNKCLKKLVLDEFPLS